jgi:hypothetical protein
MSRQSLRERSDQRRRDEQQAKQEGFWPDLCARIKEGQMIPIVSNALFNDMIFDMDGDQILGVGAGEEVKGHPSIEEQLAEAWAAEIGFPLDEPNRLPRVALFDRVINSSDDRAAKRRYLNWLKDSLLFLAEDDEEVDPEQLEGVREESEQYSFADIAAALGYPKPVRGQRDPLQLLAKLRLPIYITTSHFDFLERAIRADHREPRTQICFWSQEPVTYVDTSHRTDSDFAPTAENPLVYHIFGLEAYPESMVLNEDDYLDFLAKISGDTSQEKPILPVYLRKAMTQSSLLLLGYRLRDWDFRILFRVLLHTKRSSLTKFNLAIQLNPDQQGLVASADQVRDYLVKYFGSSHFTVEWGSPHLFIERLWEAWDQWRR